MSPKNTVMCGAITLRMTKEKALDILDPGVKPEDGGPIPSSSSMAATSLLAATLLEVTDLMFSRKRSLD